MWKKIENQELIDQVYPGSMITSNPEDLNYYFEVRTIDTTYIQALHKEGMLSLKIFPKDKLLTSNWWVKE